MPDNVMATLGTSVTFNCSASGSEDISYRWTRTMVSTDGSLVNVGLYYESSGRFVGVNSSMLTILNVGVVDIEEGQDYTCFVDVGSTNVGYRTAILQARSELMPAYNYWYYTLHYTPNHAFKGPSCDLHLSFAYAALHMH